MSAFGLPSHCPRVTVLGWAATKHLGKEGITTKVLQLDEELAKALEDKAVRCDGPKTGWPCVKQ